jgi:hypothetical protein
MDTYRHKAARVCSRLQVLKAFESKIVNRSLMAIREVLSLEDLNDRLTAAVQRCQHRLGLQNRYWDWRDVIKNFAFSGYYTLWEEILPILLVHNVEEKTTVFWHVTRFELLLSSQKTVNFIMTDVRISNLKLLRHIRPNIDPMLTLYIYTL